MSRGRRTDEGHRSDTTLRHRAHGTYTVYIIAIEPNRHYSRRGGPSNRSYTSAEKQPRQGTVRNGTCANSTRRPPRIPHTLPPSPVGAWNTSDEPDVTSTSRVRLSSRSPGPSVFIRDVLLATTCTCDDGPRRGRPRGRACGAAVAHSPGGRWATAWAEVGGAGRSAGRPGSANFSRDRRGGGGVF